MSTSDLERYPAYKQSGVEWLGEIPSHWNLIRNKDLFFERGTVSQSGDEILLTVSHITGVTRRSEKTVNMFMAETMEGYKHCKTGDLVVNTMWAWMGALGTAREDGICSPAYGVYAPRKRAPYNHKYFDYLYRTPGAVAEMTRNSKGIVSSRLRLYPKDFLQILTAVPDYREQTAIAAYVDIKTSQIDCEIELLSTKAIKYAQLKLSLVKDAVTRGLNKSVDLKHSDLEWADAIPAHWETKRVKEVGLVVLGKMLDTEPSNGKFLRSYLKSKNIGWLKVEGAEIEQMYFSAAEMKSYRLKKGDILLSEGGEVGKTAFWNEELEECYIQNSVHKITVHKKNCARFFLYQSFLLGSTKYYDSLVSHVSIKHLTKEKLSRVRWICPPIEEQIGIAAFLDEKTTQIDCIVTAINGKIAKLGDLRRALINDVVTGKIRVVGEGKPHE